MATPKYIIWDYRTIVELGSGCRTFAPQRFMDMGSRRIGIVTDRGLMEAGVVDLVKDIFSIQTGAPKIAGIFDQVGQDASISKINECARWYRENAMDGILAIGGGSVMDTAKGVRFLIAMKELDIRKLVPGNVILMLRPQAKPLNVPSVFMPTTAGTGSEISNGAVIFNEEDKVKANLVHQHLAPDIALLDPDLTVSLPPRLTAATGLDALGHAMEGISSTEASCMSQALNIQAIKLIMKYLPMAVHDGKNLEARTKMLAASNLAIKGMEMGASSPCHNVAHAVGAKFRIHHGEAVGQATPVLMEHFAGYYARNAADLADAFRVDGAIQDPLAVVAAAREKIVALMKDCGFGTQFQIALDAKERLECVQAIGSDPSSTGIVPEPILHQVVASLFPAKA